MRNLKMRLGAVLVFVSLALAWAMVGAESHWGPRYLVWRQWRVGSWDYGIRFLNVDPDFRLSFVGKPRSELTKWFPYLRPGRSRPDVCLTSPAYEQFLRDQRERQRLHDQQSQRA